MTMEKIAQTEAPIHELIARRWSPRAIDPDRAVPHDHLLSLLEAARWAPSCFGDEPWHFLVCDREADRGAWDAALSCLTEKNQSWARRAPLLIVAVAAAAFHATGKPNRWGQYDTGAASENLCLQATALGLAVHQMGGFDVDRARRSFGIPEEYTPMAFIAVGFPGDPAVLQESLRERELAERERRPLAETCFAGRWGQGLGD